jgi:rare lipoprotein A
MKKNIFFLFFFFIYSCQNFNQANFTYEKIGFAGRITDSKNNILGLNNLLEEESIHSSIPFNTQVKITNLINNKSVILKIDKNSTYNNGREILISKKYFDLLELSNKFPLIKIETIRVNKTFTAEMAKIFEEEKKVVQNIETQSVDVVDLSRNNLSKDNLSKIIIIYYGDFSYKNSATDFANSLKKELKNINPNILQINKKFRVEALSINNVDEFDIFFNKITNTKFQNYNISVK